MTDTTTPARPARRTTISDLMKVYRAGERFSVVTAYAVSYTHLTLPTRDLV